MIFLKSKIPFIFLFLTSAASYGDILIENPRASELLTQSIVSIYKNIVPLQSGDHLTAGSSQFRSLWTRDFCHSAHALLKLNRSDIVKNQLDQLIKFRRKTDGLLPRTLDSISAQERVVAEIANTLFGTGHLQQITEPLLPEYINENHTESIDSNILMLITAIDYLKFSKDTAWWLKNESALIEIFKYYENKKIKGLIQQPAYSDWQDSVKREGFTFYTNLLYGILLRELVSFPSFHVSKNEADEFKNYLHKSFYDRSSGLYYSVKDYPQVSLDGLLLALNFDYFDRESSQLLFENLKKSNLWKNGPGFVTTPDYPSSWVSTTTKLVGLSHYHDQYYWSWLMGLSLKIALKYNDSVQSEQLINRLATLAHRDNGIGELFFNNKNYNLWKSYFLKAEVPFSWGASYIVDALIE